MKHIKQLIISMLALAVLLCALGGTAAGATRSTTARNFILDLSFGDVDLTVDSGTAVGCDTLSNPVTLPADFGTKTGDTITICRSNNAAQQHSLTLAKGYTVILDGITLSGTTSPIVLAQNNSATLQLKQGTTSAVTAAAGNAAVWVQEGATLTINGKGALVAQAENGAAIGTAGAVSPNTTTAKIVIQDGTVTASSQEGQAIGNGKNTTGAVVTVTGGSVKANTALVAKNGTGTAVYSGKLPFTVKTASAVYTANGANYTIEKAHTGDDFLYVYLPAGAQTVEKDGVSYSCVVKAGEENIFSVDDSAITLEKITDTYVYNAVAQKPTPKLYYENSSGKKIDLTESASVLYTYTNNIGAGQNATVTATLAGTGINRTATFSIEACPLQTSMITAIEDVAYDAQEHKPLPIVKLGALTLQKDTHYTVEYPGTDYTQIGQQLPVKINAIAGSGFSGSATTTFNITATSLTPDMVSDITGTYTYSGHEQTPVPNVQKDSVNLVQNTDFTCSYMNNIQAGTATVTITGTGSYSGSVDKTFTIQPKPLSEVTVADVPQVVYSGMAQTPTLQVSFSYTDATGGTVEIPLAAGADYTTLYTDNTNAGTATITITAAQNGNYSGSQTKNFIIAKKPLTDDMLAAVTGTYVYSGQPHTPTPAVQNGATNLVKDTDFTYSYSQNINAGTATVTATATQASNYTGAVNKTFTIAKAPLAIRADNKTVLVGTAVPQATYTATGIVNGETLPNGAVTVSMPSGVSTAAAAVYTIGIYNDASKMSNYAPTLYAGELQVVAVSPPKAQDSALTSGGTPAVYIPTASLPSGVARGDISLVAYSSGVASNQLMTAIQGNSYFTNHTAMEIYLYNMATDAVLQPAGSVSVALPFPKGSDSDCTFYVKHLKADGIVENIAATKLSDGLRFDVGSFSPFVIGWTKNTASASSTVVSSSAAVSSSVSSSKGGGAYSDDPYEDYWLSVLDAVNKSATGTTIKTDVEGNTVIPAYVLTAVKNKKTNLILTDNKNKLTVNGYAIAGLDTTQNYKWDTLAAWLKEHPYQPATSSSAVSASSTASSQVASQEAVSSAVSSDSRSHAPIVIPTQQSKPKDYTILFVVLALIAAALLTVAVILIVRHKRSSGDDDDDFTHTIYHR
ncbi:MAG: MBG domain-containing protein [Oscillospiraceae bacterium]|nr:MBG domain-containing protein [Oscillospiraceae bacterium]